MIYIVIIIYIYMEKSLYSKLNDKGQITIPADIRNKMELSPGSRFEFLNKENFIVMLPVNKSLKDLKGFLPKPNKVLSCDEINEIIKSK
jgi:antitoxin PrlF